MEVTINVDLVDLIIILIIGFIAGSAAAALILRGGGSMLYNTLLGVIGAIIGQFIFSSLNINLQGELLQRSISIADIVIAFVGAVLLLLLVSVVRR